MKKAGMLSILMLISSCVPAFASDEKKFKVELEFSPVWQTRNDARIPNSTGTEFALRDIQGSGPFAGGRISVDYAVNPKHEIRIMAAPLTITSTGDLNKPVFFNKTSFAAGPGVKARYEFNSYRLTYRYRIYAGNRWTWKLGVTGKIRDAKIELSNAASSDVYTDLGFVPLVHLDGECRMAERWRFQFNMDGLGAPQGRALDISVKAKYDLSKNWTVAGGYRMLEGGADVDKVFTFAWLHYATASISFGF